MRRMFNTTVLAAVALAISPALAAPAHAAEGVLLLNGKSIANPHGCYHSKTTPLTVQNHTDGTAYVFDIETCSGEVAGTVEPGALDMFEHGQSVYIF